MAERTDIVNDLNTCGVLNGDPLYPLIIRARDEIVALRTIADLAVGGGFGGVVKQARAEALEVAAQWLEKRGDYRAIEDATDVRALK